MSILWQQTKTPLRVLELVLILGSFARMGFSQMVAPLEKTPYDPRSFPVQGTRVLFARKEYLKEGEDLYKEIRSLWIASEDFSHVRFISYMDDLVSVSPDDTKIVFRSLDTKSASALGLLVGSGYCLYDLKTGASTPLPDLSGRILWAEDGRCFFFERGVHGLFKYTTGRTEKVREMGKAERIVDAKGKNYLVGPWLKLADLQREKLLYVQKAVELGAQLTTGTQTFTLTDDYMWIMDLSNGAILGLGKGTQPVFSPDGSMILYRKDGELWAVSPDGTRNGRIGLGGHPVFSPDGRRLAFVDLGFDGVRHHWFNLCVADLANGGLNIVPKNPEWKETMARFLPAFLRSFERDPWFIESRPNILWFSGGDSLLYSVGWSTFFLADLEKNETRPILYWDVQVEAVAHYLTEHERAIVLSCAYSRTPRRSVPPLSAPIRSGRLNEYDIWQVSLDGKHRRMLMENGYQPIRLHLE